MTKSPSSLLLVLILAALAHSSLTEVLIITSDEENTLPVFEVYDVTEDRVKTVQKVLGLGRSDLLPSPGSGRLIEKNLLVQYQAETGEAWLLADTPENIDGAASVKFGDSVCSVGGYDATTNAATNQVKCWNPLSTKAARSDSNWIPIPSMTTARYRPGSVVMDGKLYVAGGYDPISHKFLSSVEVFDDISEAWYSLPGMRQGRAGLGLAAVEGRLYAAGGWRDHQYLRSVEMYDPLTSGWKEVTPMQEARGKLGTMAAGGFLFAVGGVSGFRDTDQLDTLERYYPADDRWEMMGARLGIRGPVSIARVDS